MEDTEVWKAIPSLDGWYDASSHGRIRSWRRMGGSGPSRHERAIEPRILKASAKTGRVGYLRVDACPTSSDRRNVSVHILVAEAFIGPRPPGMDVRHLDCNHLNNRPENLAYGTPKENMADTVANGRSRRGERNASSKLKDAEVLEIVGLMEQGWSNSSIAREYGVGCTAISDIRTGKKWSWLTGIGGE